MTKQGWRQPATGCIHAGLLGAVFTIGRHPEGHEWVCGCGKVFVVRVNAEGHKTLVPR